MTPHESRPRPIADPRLRRAAVTYLGLVLSATATLAALVLWHLIRRGRLIRERLGPPRVVRLTGPEPTDPLDEHPHP